MITKSKQDLDRNSRITGSVVQFLLNHQCVLQELLIREDQVIYPIQFTRSGPVFKVRLEIQDSRLHWSFENDQSGQAAAGALFRLNPFLAVKPLYEPHEERLSFFGKANEAARRVFFQAACIGRHFKKSGLDWQTRCLIRDLWESIFSSPRSVEGGFLCRWQLGENGGARIEVIDHGGILDDNPNVEGHACQPRVMANYYADGYAAYCFLRKYQDSGDEEHFEAAIAALDFLIRSYANYPRGVTWHHHEFKNPAFIECLYLLEGMGRLPPRYRDFVQQLRLDRYEPTNVFSLRYYWMTLQGAISNKRDEKRIEECRERLLRDTTPDGLILDNNPPMYTGARDLTYHQYSLACLAGALTIEPNDAAIKEIFLRGCAFSSATMLRNGELSYNGRGAHNIYHIAAAVYAFAFARNRYGFSAWGVERMLALLDRHGQEDGSLPTALNDYSEERMGWNHCRTPYNALSAFLLIKARDEGLHHWAGERPNSQFMESSGYAIYRGTQYEAALFCGLGESYVYSGAHRTGVSGLAALVPLGGEPLNLILSRSLRDDNLLTTDLPTFQIAETIIEPIGGRISQIPNGWSWILETVQFVYERQYSFGEKCITVNNRLKKLTSEPIKVAGWWAFAVNSSTYKSRVKGAVLYIDALADATTCSLAGKSAYELSDWKARPVISNPRGRGILFQRSVVFSEGGRSELFEDLFTIEMEAMHAE